MFPFCFLQANTLKVGGERLQRRLRPNPAGKRSPVGSMHVAFEMKSNTLKLRGIIRQRRDIGKG